MTSLPADGQWRTAALPRFSREIPRRRAHSYYFAPANVITRVSVFRSSHSSLASHHDQSKRSTAIIVVRTTRQHHGFSARVVFSTVYVYRLARSLVVVRETRTVPIRFHPHRFAVQKTAAAHPTCPFTVLRRNFYADLVSVLTSVLFIIDRSVRFRSAESVSKTTVAFACRSDCHTIVSLKRCLGGLGGHSWSNNKIINTLEIWGPSCRPLDFTAVSRGRVIFRL